MPSHPSAHDPRGVHFYIPRPFFAYICSKTFPLEILANINDKHVATIIHRQSRLGPFLRHKGPVESRFPECPFIFCARKGAVVAQNPYALRPEEGHRTLNSGPRLRGHPRAWDDGPKDLQALQGRLRPRRGSQAPRPAGLGPDRSGQTRLPAISEGLHGAKPGPAPVLGGPPTVQSTHHPSSFRQGRWCHIISVSISRLGFLSILFRLCR